MKIARLAVLGIAIVAGGIAALLASRSDAPPPAAPAPVVAVNTTEILVAKKDVNIGQTIGAQDMEWVAWPASAANPLYVRRADRPDAIEQLSGAIARVPIASGEPVRESKLIKAKGSGYMAAILPSGMRAVSTEISAETGAGGFILPNDRVDVILSRRDREAERLTGIESQIAETLLSDVRVLAIDQNVEEKNGQKVVVGRTATLELTPRQVETLAMGRLMGSLSLALRSLADSDPSKQGDVPPPDDFGALQSFQHGPVRRDDDDDTEMRKKALPMPKRTIPRVVTLPACLAAVIVASLGLAWAGQSAANPPAPPPVKIVASEFGSNFVPLGVGKSVVVDVPRDIKDVLVGDPKIANAVVRTSRRAYLIGVDVGQTSVYFFDAEGRQLAAFDVAVTRDLNGLRAMLKQMFPEGNVHVEGIGKNGVVLSGAVATPIEAQQAYDIAARLVGDTVTVVNQITIRGRDQVMLKVTVAEIQREVIKQFGINMTTTGTGLGQGQAVLKFVTNNPFSAALESIGNSKVDARFGSVASTLQAMERAGVIRMLAEPTLTAISGESATFLAGGEFPIPGIPACNYTTTGALSACTPSVDYKKFGVTLNFTPVVLGEGKISLKVITEVSSLAAENSLTLNYTGTNSTITVPSLKVRRADTTVEIPSGGALAMAGMLQDHSAAALNGFPGLMDLPVLGTLFRSRDFLNEKTELMILVAPYVVHAVSSKELARPDDGYADSPDPSAVLLGRLNRIYGGPGTADAPGPYRGNYGFIID